MQKRGSHLKKKSLAVPQGPKKPHNCYSLKDRASESANAAETEHLTKELIIRQVETV